ncbi:hypothetical protein HRbin15_00995 [bacterium HR15]|nr:hypothetical protein HRbin15_00995 [bacterium HR15]
MYKHFRKPIIPFIMDAVRGKQQSAMEEFLEEAEKWEPPNTFEEKV